MTGDLGGIPYELKRGSFRNLSMTFDRTGKLIISAPYNVSEDEVRLFLNAHMRWIRKNHVKISSLSEGLFDMKIGPGGRVMYLGEVLETDFYQGKRIKKSDGRLLFPEGSDIGTFENRLKKNAADYLKMRLEYRASEMGISYRKLRISGAKSKWGSCSETGVITLAWHLMMCPPDCIEYVIIHELCHRIHMDHSKAFWAEVEKYMPDYGKHKKWLDDHSHIMEMKGFQST